MALDQCRKSAGEGHLWAQLALLRLEKVMGGLTGAVDWEEYEAKMLGKEHKWVSSKAGIGNHCSACKVIKEQPGISPACPGKQK